MTRMFSHVALRLALARVLAFAATTTLALSGCVEGIWDDPFAVDDDTLDPPRVREGDDDDDDEGLLDGTPPPSCQTSSAPFLEDDAGVVVLQQRSAYDKMRGTLLIVSMLANVDQSGFDVARVALDGSVLSRRAIFPELSREQALPWRLAYNADEDHFALVLLVPHYNRGGELRFVRLTLDGEPLDEPTPYETRANDASIAWDPVHRTYALARTRQGGLGEGELVVSTGNPPAHDEPPVLATTENDFNQGSIAGFCPGCASDGAFVVQDGANANVLVDAAGARILEQSPFARVDFQGTLLGDGDFVYGVSVLGGPEGGASVWRVIVADAREPDVFSSVEDTITVPRNAFLGRAFLDDDGTITALAWGRGGTFDIARADQDGWIGGALRHLWGSPFEPRIHYDVVDAVMTPQGALVVHTPPAPDGSAGVPGLVITRMCAP